MVFDVMICKWLVYDAIEPSIEVYSILIEMDGVRKKQTRHLNRTAKLKCLGKLRNATRFNKKEDIRNQ